MMAYVKDAATAWFQKIGATNAQKQLESAIVLTKDRAENDGVIYKEDENMNENEAVIDELEVQEDNLAEDTVVQENDSTEDTVVKEDVVETPDEVQEDSANDESVDKVELKEGETVDDANVEEKQTIAEITGEDLIRSFNSLVNEVQSGFSELSDMISNLSTRISYVEEEVYAIPELKEELNNINNTFQKQAEDLQLVSVPHFTFKKEDVSTPPVTKNNVITDDVDNLVQELLKEAPEGAEEIEQTNGNVPLFVI